MQLKNNDDIANYYDSLTLDYGERSETQGLSLDNPYPFAYMAKKWFFCGLPFYINKHVLVPRADTESLINCIPQGDFSVLDLCTGSGCIAIALAKKGFTRISASDICAKALKVAKKNARLNKVKVHFIQSDLFESIKGQFDIIVCNPPYIKTNELGKYDKSTLHEPKIALDGGADGLDFYRKIISQANCKQIFFEVGDKLQAEQVKTLLHNANFCDITIIGNHIIHARKT